MSKKYYINILTNEFGPLPGEDDEIVNPGNYGKALAMFLREKLEFQGYVFSFLVAEDFGWWLEVKNSPFHLGIIVVRNPVVESETEYICQLSSDGGRGWSWKKLWFVDRSDFLSNLWRAIIHVLKSEPRVSLLFEGLTDGCD